MSALNLYLCSQVCRDHLITCPDAPVDTDNIGIHVQACAHFSFHY